MTFIEFIRQMRAQGSKFESSTTEFQNGLPMCRRVATPSPMLCDSTGELISGVVD